MKDEQDINASIDQALRQISAELQLSSQTERELLDEIRGHLEDALDEAVQQGRDPDQVIHDVCQRFGVEDVAAIRNMEFTRGRDAIIRLNLCDIS